MLWNVLVRPATLAHLQIERRTPAPPLGMLWDSSASPTSRVTSVTTTLFVHVQNERRTPAPPGFWFCQSDVSNNTYESTTANPIRPPPKRTLHSAAPPAMLWDILFKRFKRLPSFSHATSKLRRPPPVRSTVLDTYQQPPACSDTSQNTVPAVLHENLPPQHHPLVGPYRTLRSGRRPHAGFYNILAFSERRPPPAPSPAQRRAANVTLTPVSGAYGCTSTYTSPPTARSTYFEGWAATATLTTTSAASQSSPTTVTALEDAVKRSSKMLDGLERAQRRLLQAWRRHLNATTWDLPQTARTHKQRHEDWYKASDHSRRDDVYRPANVRATSFERFTGDFTVVEDPDKYKLHRAMNATLGVRLIFLGRVSGASTIVVVPPKYQ
ncbi:hypothetical protein FRC04_006578, partial [Tulasnella sp. 424]